VLSEDLLSILSVLKLYSPMELFQFSCRTLHLSWLTLMNFVSPFLQLVKVTVNGIHLSRISSASLVWCHPRTIWGYILCHYQSHWWDLVSTPKEHQF